MNLSQTTLQIGLEAPFRALHLSDSHICLAEPSDGERKTVLAQKRANAFDEGEPGRTAARLQSYLLYADENRLPILYTGDFCDFTSSANFTDLKETLFSRNCLFTAGNHEFSQYVGEAWEDEAYKQQSFARVQAVCPDNLTFSGRILGGINFVMVDDVYYNFTAAQLELLKAEVRKGLPIVLMLHVPLYTPDLYDYMMDVLKETSAYLTGTPDAFLDRFPPMRQRQQKTDASTRAFIDYVCSQSAVIRGVLAGHLHYDFETVLPGGIPQIVTGGTYRNCGRLITFV